MIVSRAICRIGVCVVAAVMITAASAPIAFAQGAPTAAQSQAWTESLAAETSGDLLKARSVMVSAFGEQPDAYAPCIRLAWLSLQLNRGHEAAQLYRRARQLPGSLPEATQGLILALARAGYESLDRGDLPDARRNWQEAVRLSPDQPDALAGLDIVGPSTGASPEVWGGRLTSTPNSSSANVFYLQVPVRINDHVTVRGAFRNIMSPSFGSGTSSAFQSQQEWFGGVAVEQGILAVELVGLRLHSASSDTNGAAVNVRAGGRAGMTLMFSSLNDSTNTNTQVMPQAFVWVSPTIAIAGGVRVTNSSSSTTVSGVAGATVKMGALQIDALGHAGTERSALSIAGPTILSFVNDTTSGATVTAAYRITPTATAFAQFQIEQLSASAGQYTSIAGGIRFALNGK